MNHLNTAIGAAIAALILFLSSLVTLFTENPDLTFESIRQASWVSMIGGAAIAFLKDYQAISTRRWVGKVTKKSDGIPLHPLAAILSGLLVFAMLAGCGTFAVERPNVNSTSDAIVVTAADLESVAAQVLEACGNTQPGGDCADGALVSTSQKEQWRDALEKALDSLKLANHALAIADDTTAETRLAAAQAILRAVRAEVARSR